MLYWDILCIFYMVHEISQNISHSFTIAWQIIFNSEDINNNFKELFFLGDMKIIINCI